jgi:ABC-type transport system involved in multi-copper enzyme maturation permease subunit
MAQTENEPAEEDALPVPPPPEADWKDRLRQGRSGVARFTVDNPVLVKEFRTRMRGTRAYWILLIYTLLLAGVLAMMYFSYEASVTQQTGAMAGGPGTGAQDLGRNIYYFVFIAQALMVALITPAITSGTLTIEREQRSYELLVTTPLRPADLVRGKLTAAVAFVLLLLTASLPLVSMSFLVGGVSPAEIFLSYLIIGCSAFVYGATGIFWSATLRTTAAATVVTYLSVLALFILTSVPGMIAASSAISGGKPDVGIAFQSINPIAATFRALQPEYFFATQLPSWVSAVIVNLLLGLVISVGAMGRLEHFDPPAAAWLRGLSTLLWGSFVAFLFGAVIGGASPNWNAVTYREPTGWILIWMLVLVALVTPIMNTGDLVMRRGESALGRYLTGLLPHRMLANDLSCGYPLVLAWGIFLFALLPLGLQSTGKLGLVPVTGMLLPAMILSAVVFSALAGVGNLLSVTLPSRWAACVLTYLFGVVTMLLPYFTLFPWFQTNRPRTMQIWHQVLYFVPFEGLNQMIAPDTYLSERPPLLFGSAVPVWLITTLLYFIIAVACFALTAGYVARAGKRLEAQAPNG